MMRRYAGKWHHFIQPDPYDGSYDWTNPQSFNRYAYVQNDPVNFVDPSGLDPDIDIGVFFAGDIVAEQGMVGTFGFGGEVGMVIDPEKPIMAEGLNPQRPREVHGQLNACLRTVLSKFFDKKLLADIRIHVDSSLVPPTMAAITLGDHIHFKQGEFNPRTLAGITLLAHEIAHSAQYRAVGTKTFVETYAASSIAVTSGVGLLAAMVAATKGINLPHDLNVYEQAAEAKASEVRNALVNLNYGGEGLSCPP